VKLLVLLAGLLLALLAVVGARAQSAYPGPAATTTAVAPVTAANAVAPAGSNSPSIALPNTGTGGMAAQRSVSAWPLLVAAAIMLIGSVVLYYPLAHRRRQ